MQQEIRQKKINTLIFDLDGVITDSFMDVADAVNGALEVLGIAPRPYEYIRKHFNNGDRNIIAKALSADNEHFLEQGMSLYLDIYAQSGFPKTKLFPRVREVLEYYQSKNLVVLTNKVEKIARLHLEKLGIASSFKIIAGAESVPLLKPEPDGILWMIEKLGAVQEETVMIGDSLADVQAGKAAGVLTCALSSGYTEEEILRQACPDLLLDSLWKLVEVLPA